MLALSTRCLKLDPGAERPDLDRLLGFDVAGHELAGRLSEPALRETAAAIREAGRTLTNLLAPCPTPERRLTRGWPSLCDPDASQRAVAVTAARHSLEWAARLEVPVVVVRGMNAGIAFPEEATALLDTPAWADAPGRALRDAFQSARAARARPRMDAFCFALDALLGRADELDLELAMEPRGHPGALPDRNELASLVARFAGAPLGTWYHAAAAWWEEQLTLDTAAEWRDTCADTLAGARIDDRDRRRQYLLPPGEGALDYPALGQSLPHDVPCVLTGHPNWDHERMVAALDHLRDSGVGDSAPPPADPFPIIGGS